MKGRDSNHRNAYAICFVKLYEWKNMHEVRVMLMRCFIVATIDQQYIRLKIITLLISTGYHFIIFSIRLHPDDKC